MREGGDYDRAGCFVSLLVVVALAALALFLVFGIRDCARAAVESAKTKTTTPRDAGAGMGRTYR